MQEKDASPPPVDQGQSAEAVTYSTSKIPTHIQRKYMTDGHKFWDKFYNSNGNRFFKDRHWTLREFPELVEAASRSDSEATLFEVGCGAGNFVLPLLEETSLRLKIYACDFAAKAVALVQVW